MSGRGARAREVRRGDSCWAIAAETEWEMDDAEGEVAEESLAPAAGQRSRSAGRRAEWTRATAPRWSRSERRRSARSCSTRRPLRRRQGATCSE